jgi:hypothetical protein
VTLERAGNAEERAFYERHRLVTYEWAGFRLHFGEHAAFGSHLEKLAGFVDDLDELRQPLRACARALARALGSPKIAYGPDSAGSFEYAFDAVGEACTFEDAIARVAVQCGPPAPTIAAIFDGPIGYFI